MCLLLSNFTSSSICMKRQFAPSWLFQATEYAYADTGNNVHSWKFHSLYLKSHVVYSKKFNTSQVASLLQLQIYFRFMQLLLQKFTTKSTIIQIAGLQLYALSSIICRDVTAAAFLVSPPHFTQISLSQVSL